MNLVKLIYYALTSVIKEMNIIMASRVDKVVSLYFVLCDVKSHANYTKLIIAILCDHNKLVVVIVVSRFCIPKNHVVYLL